MKRKAEVVVEDADITACYFRRLVDEGVPTMAAISITGSYIQSLIIAERADEDPSEPWQKDT